MSEQDCSQCKSYEALDGGLWVAREAGGDAVEIAPALFRENATCFLAALNEHNSNFIKNTFYKKKMLIAFFIK